MLIKKMRVFYLRSENISGLDLATCEIVNEIFSPHLGIEHFNVLETLRVSIYYIYSSMYYKMSVKNKFRHFSAFLF